MLRNQPRLFGILIASVFIGLVVSGFTGNAPASSHSTPVPANGKIAYVGGTGLRTMNADGSDVRDVTRGLSVGSYPDWSPDGTRLAFSVSTAPGGSDEIYVSNADGSALRNLTPNSSGFKSYPSWSPDGNRISFWKFSPGHSSLYVMDADGRNQTLVMEDAEVGLWDRGWSPDGSRIAFSIDHPDAQGFPKPDIYIMNADGSGRARLTDTPGFDGDPNWSPDGSKIVFTSHRDGFSAIYIMNPDGSDQRQLISGHCAFLKPSVQPPPSPAVCLGDEHATWSPDGTMVAFVGFASDGGYSDIFVVDADGTNERRLTHTEEFEFFPSWQPVVPGLPPLSTSVPSPTVMTNRTASQRNGKIVFDVIENGAKWGIGVVNADGSDWKQIAPIVMMGAPAWSPDGRKIAFNNGTLHVVNPDGSGLTNLGHYGWYPTWSPDGSRIRFAQAAADGTWLVEVDVDGRDPARLFRVGEVQEVAWSPGGTRYAFGRGSISIVAHPPGAGVDLPNIASGRDPDWSPDGSKIAYEVWPFGDVIWTMNADGSNQKPLTRHRSCEGTPTPAPGPTPLRCDFDRSPTWSPDGMQIAFIRTYLSGTSDVWVVNADGTGERQVTDTPQSETEPDWQPVIPGLSPSPPPGTSTATEACVTPSPVVSASPDWSPSVTEAPELALTTTAAAALSPTPSPLTLSTPADASPAVAPSPELAPRTPEVYSGGPFVTPTPSATGSLDCEVDGSTLLGARDQAMALIAVGGIAAATALLLPAAALVRRSHRRYRVRKPRQSNRS